MKNSSQSSFSPLLHLTYVLQHLSDENLLASGGVGLSQTRIMSALAESSASSQSRVARELHQTEANVSRQLKEMKKHGLVSVVRNKKDARQRDVKLSAKGARKYKEAVKTLNAQQSQLFKLLDKKDQKAFDQAAGNLLSALNVPSSARKLGS